MKHTVKALIGGSMVATIMLSSCATIFNRTQQPVSVSSTPSGLAYTVTDSAGQQVGKGMTPGSITLKTSDGYFKSASYQFTFKKGGKVVGTQTLTGTVSGWYFGNILLGGLIGMLAIDPLTGAMYTLADEVNQGGLPTIKTSASGSITVLDFSQLSPQQKAGAKKL